MSIPSWVKVGAKCVCVDTLPRTAGRTKLRYGNVYTVTGIGNKDDIFLKEVKANYEEAGLGFYADRFRPLISQSDDIAMFKALIAPTPELVATREMEPMGSGLPR